MYGYSNKRFVRETRLHRWLFRAILALQLTVAIAIIWLIVVVVQAANKADWSNGVKPVIERAWCGKPGCFSAS